MRKKSNNTVKVCFVASSGGHYEQLLMLKPLMEKYNSFVVTEKTTYNTMLDGESTYYVHQVNRKEKSCLFWLVVNTVKSIGILIKERPNVVISIGVLATIPLCLLVKISGGKLIYIESFAKVDSATMTGKLMYRFADRFYVQWEPMMEIYPNALYLGGIY